jgi:YidC/Oxa1 family membrane protein insertase
VINFPAGLLVYWITTNFWTIVQQTIVRKRLGPMRPPSDDGDGPPMSIMDRVLHARGRGGGASGDGVGEPAGSPGKLPDRSGSSGTAQKTRPAAPPPPSPRKKKKRSGRRR